MSQCHRLLKYCSYDIIIELSDVTVVLCDYVRSTRDKGFTRDNTFFVEIFLYIGIRSKYLPRHRFLMLSTEKECVHVGFASLTTISSSQTGVIIS